MSAVMDHTKVTVRERHARSRPLAAFFVAGLSMARSYTYDPIGSPNLTVQLERADAPRVEFFELQGFNFGLRSAVMWFNRLGTFLNVRSHLELRTPPDPAPCCHPLPMG